MRTVKCTFWVDVPSDVSREDVEAWLKFECHQIGEMKLSNPLSDTELEAKNLIVTMYV